MNEPIPNPRVDQKAAGEACSEQAIRASEIRYRRLFETAQDGILILDGETGEVVDANPLIEELLGYSHAEFAGKKFGEIAPFQKGAASKLDFVRLQHAGRLRCETLPLETKLGNRIEVEFTSRSYLAGERPFIQCNIRDITERKEAEMASLQLAAIVDSSDDAIIGKDLSGMITSWNKGAERIFGYTAAEMVGTPIMRLIPEDRQEEEHLILARIKRGESLEHFETLRQTKEGKLIDISVTVSPIKDRSGKILGVSKVARDITESKRAEAALQESEARLRLVLHAAQIGDWEIDPVTRVMRCAELFCQIFGYTETAPQWSYEKFLGHVHFEDRLRVNEITEDGFATGQDWRFECRIVRRDQAVRWVAVQGRFFREPGGQPLRVLGIVEDITERIHAQERSMWLATFPERSPNPIFELDLAGTTFHYLNAAATEQFPELESQGLRHPLLGGWQEIAAELLKSGTLQREVTIGKSCLSQVWTYLADSGRVRVYSTDITERRTAELALREKEAQFHLANRRLAEIVQGMTEACFALDTEWRFTFVNERTEALLHHRNEEMLGRPIWEVFKKLVGTPMEANYRRAMAERVPVAFEVFSPIAERWLDIRLFPTAEGLAAFLLDVDSRKQAEAAVRESEDRFRTLANSMPQLAWIAQADGHISWYNERWYQYTGTTPEQMEGWGWQAVHNSEVLPKVLEKWKTAIDSGQPLEIEFPLRGADGRFRNFLTRVQPMKDSKGAVLQWFGTNTDVDELKQMEASLRSTQARLNSTLSAGSIGTWTWDIPHDRLSGDEFTARAFSIETEAAAKGLPAAAYLQAVLEEDQAGVSLGLAKAIETCGKYDIEYRVRQEDGSVLWLQARGRVEGDEAGTAVNFHGAVMDITARKLAEAEVRASAKKLRQVIDGLGPNTFLWLMTVEGMLIEANRPGLVAAGVEAGEVLGKPFDQTVWWDYSEPARERLREAMARGAAGEGSRYDVQVRMAGSALVWIDFSLNPVRDANGRVIYLVPSGIVIEERVLAEAAIRRSEAHFRFLNDLSETARTLADPAQIMAEMARMLGEHLRASRCAYADVENDGERFTILHDFTDGCASTVGQYQLSLFGSRAVSTLRAGQTLIIRDVEAELLPEDGAEMFKSIGIQAIITCPLVKQDGLRAMMAVHQTVPRDWQPGEIAMVQDTVERCWSTIERRSVEERVRQLNAELEQRVIERTEQLESANKELEAFSYSVSHDLRAPLRAVDGFSQAVIEDYGEQLPKEGQAYLRTIREGAQKMGMLIDDLLAFSRLSRMPIRRQKVDANRQVRETLMELSANASAVEIHIGALEDYEGDPALMKQVWVNLLSNAFKYTSKRTGAIVEVGASRENGRTVYFVRDNGTGFDMRYANKLFGVFQRLHRQDEFEGTGVGLAIVQRVIHRHGGRIWADAAPDRGATFSFTLTGETEL